MNTQKVTAEYRMSQWAQVIQGRLDSGQSIKDFCQSSGISRNTFFYWQRKLREAACTELAKAEGPRSIVPDGWMRLESDRGQYSVEALTIEISGCHITVNEQTNLELLHKVCRALRSL